LIVGFTTLKKAISLLAISATFWYDHTKVGHPWVGLGFLPEPNPCGFFPLQTQINPTQLTKPRKPR